ncbi:hypothetical protein CHARACLAT_007279, partial [Characodon lateralis]|nr:hypothetical protein [Characodon lateralis]
MDQRSLVLVVFRLSGKGSCRQQSKYRRSDSPDTSSSSFRGSPMCFPGQPRIIVPPACPGLSMVLCPVGRAWNTSRGRPPGASGTPQLTPLDVEEQQLYFELLSVGLLTLSLRECLATLQRKLISAACILDLVIS